METEYCLIFETIQSQSVSTLHVEFRLPVNKGSKLYREELFNCADKIFGFRTLKVPKLQL